MSKDITSLSGFFKSIALGLIDGLRQNKVASLFALGAFLSVLVLAIGTHYDERPIYRTGFLPEITRTDSDFQTLIRDAEEVDNEQIRLFYFAEAHGRARIALSVLKQRYPRSRDALQAHGDLIRYYEFVTEELAIIRTEMNMDLSLDYIAEWKKCQAKSWPLHERWSQWVNGKDQLASVR